MRRSDVLFLGMSALGVLLGLAAIHSGRAREAAGRQLIEGQALVREYGLTDLCLFTEAGYTRHPSQSDPLSPFQEGPHTLEHFPSGSLVSPPPSPENPTP